MAHLQAAFCPRQPREKMPLLLGAVIYSPGKELHNVMGLLDIASSVLGGMISGGQPQQPSVGMGAATDVLGAVVGALNNRPGGLGGVVDSLNQSGLGSVVTQWIGHGPNPPVTTGQVTGALGEGPINDIAGRLGISPDMAGGILSQLLPHIVDHLTPNGQVPQGGLSNAGGDLIKNILGGALGSLGGVPPR